MSPLLLWQPDPQREAIYGDAEKHSDGMISFAYKPPSADDLAVLLDSDAFRQLLRETAGSEDPAKPHLAG